MFEIPCWEGDHRGRNSQVFIYLFIHLSVTGRPAHEGDHGTMYRGKPYEVTIHARR